MLLTVFGLLFFGMALPAVRGVQGIREMPRIQKAPATSTPFIGAGTKDGTEADQGLPGSDSQGACSPAWTIVSSPDFTSVTLFDAAVVSANDAWAVGAISGDPVAEHWDGSRWGIVPIINPGTGSNVLRSVAAVSTSDVWAVGEYNDGISSARQTLIERWNGTAWVSVYSPSPGSLYSELTAVAAVSASDVRAVGFYQEDVNTPNKTLVEHFDGSKWRVVPSPNPNPNGSYLFGVAVASASEAWAVGWHGYAQNGALVLRLGEQRYSDVPPGSTFYPYVQCLACRGIVSGYPNGTFGPNNPVTRGQLSKIVSNSAGYTETFSTNTFEDVPVGSTFFPYVERLYFHGGIRGYACGGALEPCVPPANKPYFRPGANVTRGQTSKIVATAKQLPPPSPGQQTFEDVAPNSTFWQWVEPLAATGAIGGYPCGGAGEPCVPPTNRPYFRPGNNVTRGQSTKIVANAFFPGCSTLRQPRK